MLATLSKIDSGNYKINRKKTVRQIIQSDYGIANGLRDLVADHALIDTLQITDDEFSVLTTIKLPKNVSQNDYLQLLITLRAITDK